MSKKKAFSGNTMTLKDFHGGSIPTDLPLPSAPGVIVRPMDRTSYDRPASWGNPIARPDHRPRPNSSPATRHFDDKTPFLAHAVHIGRNFDEDERKPLDGVSVPRRTVSDDSFRVPPSHVELKPEPVPAGRASGWAGSGSVPIVSSGAANSYAGSIVEQTHVCVNSLNSRSNGVQAVSGSYPNAWTARKEVLLGVNEPVQCGRSGQSAVSKLAHASALEKVSSGRWQSKQSFHYQAHHEIENGSHPKGYDDNTACNRMHVVGGREFSDATLARHVERGLNFEDVHGGRKEELDYERTGASNYFEVKERKQKYYTDRVQPIRADGKFSGAESLPTVHSEASERPKLKLLPRTRPLENLEPHVANSKQEYHQMNESAHGYVEAVNSMHGNVNLAKTDLAGTDVGNHAVERPKLSLKPRSQPPEQIEDSIEKGRNSLFGGARPRELVLKERGADNVAINNHDLGQHSDRVKHNISKTERAPEHTKPTRQSDTTENLPLDQRNGRKYERKDHRSDGERVDMQRRNWRNENRRNNRGTEREQQQQQHERHSSPETWRKPVEQPKQTSNDAVSQRYGKVSSALELAQAFSRSFSDPKLDDRYSGQRGFTGRTQMPFSRLMGPTSRPQINGY